MPKWFRANRDVARTIFDGMNGDEKNKYYLYTLGEEGKAYIVAWNSRDNDVLISDCENYESHNTKHANDPQPQACKIEKIKCNGKLVEALNSAYGGKKYYNKEREQNLITGKLIANANDDDDYGIGLFDSSANSSSSDSGQGSWGATLGWGQQPQQYNPTYQASSPQPQQQSNPYQPQQQYQQLPQQAYRGGYVTPQQPPQQNQPYQQQAYQANPAGQVGYGQQQQNSYELDEKHKERSHDNDDLKAKMKEIIERGVDNSDNKSNKKIESASSNYDLKIYEGDGSATKYSKAMSSLVEYIKKINNFENLTNNVHAFLAGKLKSAGFIIKGFHTPTGGLDPKFNNCSMILNPSKLNIAAFKAKHPELSDTKRYTQELIGIITKYTNLIEQMNSDQEKLDKAKFKRKLKDADDYALKFAKSILKIKNRKGHRAAITFPTALYEVKDVLIKLSELANEKLSSI